MTLQVRHVRPCPQCGQERPLSEASCETILADGQPCNFPLLDIFPVEATPAEPSGVKEREQERIQPQSDPQPPESAPPPNRSCPNGHAVAEDDVLCLICNELVATKRQDTLPAPRVPGGWDVLTALPGPLDEAELFLVRRDGDAATRLFKYYQPGIEPDPQVYPALARLETGEAAQLIDHGRFESRAFEVWEHIDSPTLGDLRSELRSDCGLLQEVAAALIATLAKFESFGLRHGGVKPSVVRVRSRAPFRLVITDFGTASLAEFDVEMARTRQPCRYMAPEAVADATTDASDWWSLGIVLLELVTDGGCFAGVNDRAFLLHLVTRGVSVPESVDAGWRELLQGLLTRDHSKRWRADQALRWASGERGIPVHSEGSAPPMKPGPSIHFNGQRFLSPAAFALAAAEEGNWNQAAALLQSGTVANWLEEIDPKSRRLSQLRKIDADIKLTEDHRVALSLAALNEDLPLCVRGEIVTPNWLLLDPARGGLWLDAAPQRHLRDLKREKDRWLVRLAERAARAQARAKDMRTALNPERFAVLRLSTSTGALEAQWRQKRELFPDAATAMLSAMFERRTLTDEDLLLLLSVETDALKPAEEVLQAAEALAKTANVREFDREAARALLRLPRPDIADKLSERLPGFTRCGRPVVDEWVDNYRANNKRIALARSLVVLAVPGHEWQEPPERDYIRNVLTFLERKVLAGVQRGPLVQLKTSKSSARIDLADLGAPKVRQEILDSIVTKREQDFALSGPTRPEQAVVDRIRKLDAQARTYRRDTGVNALMIGFPIMVLKETKSDGASATRIAPVLLWPLRISIQAGATGVVKLGFDAEREVQLNPAFDSILGPEVCTRWQSLADNLLQGGILNSGDVLQAFEDVASLAGGASIGGIPTAKAAGKAGQPQLHAAAALFLADFPSQAIVQDLRQLQQRPLEQTALECLFRLTDVEIGPPPDRPPEAERFSTLEVRSVAGARRAISANRAGACSARTARHRKKSNDCQRRC